MRIICETFGRLLGMQHLHRIKKVPRGRVHASTWGRDLRLGVTPKYLF